MPDHDRIKREIDALTKRVLAGDIPDDAPQATAPQRLSADASRCDICGAAGRGRVIMSMAMREAVFSNGFDPFKLELFSTELMSATGISPMQAYENWLPAVREDNTGWDLCPRCFEGIQPYLGRTGSAPARGNGCASAAFGIVAFLCAITLAAGVLAPLGR